MQPFMAYFSNIVLMSYIQKHVNTTLWGGSHQDQYMSLRLLAKYKLRMNHLHFSIMKHCSSNVLKFGDILFN